MPKTIFTPRDELVCGKIDILMGMLTTAEQIYVLQDIQHDCVRMEAALIARKDCINKELI